MHKVNVKGILSAKNGMNNTEVACMGVFIVIQEVCVIR